MTCDFSPARLTEILEADLVRYGDRNDQPSAGISTDSRSIGPGQVFLALRGEKFDGHAYVSQALAAGAAAVIIDAAYDIPADLPTGSVLRVADTLRAYQAIARAWRRHCPARIVAITGSVGKTTTKELLAAALATAGETLKTEANFNNEIGVPRTLLQLRPDHRFAVIEMGMRGRGQIAELAAIAEPDLVVITNVGTAHIELLGSREAIAEAKCELVADLAPERLAVLNAETPLLPATAARVRPEGRTLTYGLTTGEFRGAVAGDRLTVEGRSFVLPLPGEHNALNFLAALAVTRELGIDWENLRQLSVTLPGGRARRIELAEDVLLLDETYNAGLESMLASLKLLAQTPGQRRLAVLGTMLELGDFSDEAHRQVGEAVASLGLDGLLILAEDGAAAALQAGAGDLPSQRFVDHDSLTAALQAQLRPGDRVLFKASRGVALDRVVAALAPQP